MALDDRTSRMVFQTALARSDEGKNGAPEGFSKEEKELYLEYEKEIAENKKSGAIVNYSFPNNYDWEDGFGAIFDPK